jgi:hypothetical protein
VQFTQGCVNIETGVFLWQKKNEKVVDCAHRRKVVDSEWCYFNVDLSRILLS